MKAAILAEVAEILAAHGRMHCEPTVSVEDGVVELKVLIRPEEQSTPFAILNVHEDLRRLCDVATMRALCERYDLDPRWLENALSEKEK